LPRPRRRARLAEPLPHERLAHDLPHGAQVAADIVHDPWSPVGERHQIRVLRSVRDDPLGQLRSRGHIDMAMYEAGRRWERHHDIAGLSGVKAVNFMQEPVDGGGAGGDRWTDRQGRATAELRKAAAALGAEGTLLCHQVLGQGLPFASIAATRGIKPTDSIAHFYGKRFKECLETLAQLWGFVS
jgi:hypothetical protein